MNGRQPNLERVPLTEAEIEHLAPIADRFQQAQRDFAQAQRDVEAVVKLYRAQHKDELTLRLRSGQDDGPEWNLDRDAFVRQVPPPAPEMPPPMPQHVNGDVDPDRTSVERQVARLMEG